MNAKGDAREQELTRAQRTIARRAAESRATVPHLELAHQVAMDAALALRDCSLSAMLVRACALALVEVPRANASYRDGRFELYSRINVGITLSTADAFAIPTLFDADRKSLSGLTAEIVELEARARSGELAPPELSGGTFTLSRAGVASAAPLIVPPQAAALSAGAIRDVAAVRDGVLSPGKQMSVTLACDHRILYGEDAERFLAAITSHLEEARL